MALQGKHCWPCFSMSNQRTHRGALKHCPAPSAHATPSSVRHKRAGGVQVDSVNHPPRRPGLFVKSDPKSHNLELRSVLCISCFRPGAHQGSCSNTRRGFLSYLYMIWFDLPEEIESSQHCSFSTSLDYPGFSPPLI